MKRVCAGCGDPIPDGRGTNARFCTVACRNESGGARRRERRRAEGSQRSRATGAQRANDRSATKADARTKARRELADRLARERAGVLTPAEKRMNLGFRLDEIVDEGVDRFRGRP